jgi:hypothetical protein
MPRKITKTKIPTGPQTSLLVQMMNDMNSKLHHIHKDVEKNSKDIEKMKQEIAIGKGGVRVLVWVAGMATTIIAAWNFFLPK